MLIPITCPSCGSSLDLDEEYCDWKVRCPDCRHEFVAVLPPTPREVPQLLVSRSNPVEDCKSAAAGLAVVAIIQLCMCTLLVFFNAAVRPNVNPPINPKPDEEEAEMVFWIVVGSLGLMQAALMILGAVAMRSQRRYGLAMLASLGALIPINVCCFTAVPFGIWSLVVLARSDVKDAFAANQLEDDDPDE